MKSYHDILCGILFYFIPPPTSFSQLLLAFGCLSFNKHLLYSRNILCRLSDQSCRGLSCHFSHVCQNVTKMKYERQYQKTKPFDSWRDHHEYICGGKFPLLNPGQLIFSSDLINFYIFSHVEINCHLSVSWIQMYFSVHLFFCFLFSLLSETVTFIPLLASCENRRIVFLSI